MSALKQNTIPNTVKVKHVAKAHGLNKEESLVHRKATQK